MDADSKLGQEEIFTHLVLIYLSLAVQFEGGDAIKNPFCLPGHARKAMHCPSHPVIEHKFRVSSALLPNFILNQSISHNKHDFTRIPDTAAFDDSIPASMPDLCIIWLPDPLHVHIELLEEEASMEAQAPEDNLVVFQALEGVSGVAEHHILPVYVICGHTRV